MTNKKNNKNSLLIAAGIAAGAYFLFLRPNAPLQAGGMSSGGGSYGYLIGDARSTGALSDNRTGDIMASGTLTGIGDIDRALFAAPQGSISGVEVRRTSSGTVGVFDTKSGVSPYSTTLVASQGTTDIFYRDAATGQITGATSPTLSASLTAERAAQVLNYSPSPTGSRNSSRVPQVSPEQNSTYAPSPTFTYKPPTTSSRGSFLKRWF